MKNKVFCENCCRYWHSELNTCKLVNLRQKFEYAYETNKNHNCENYKNYLETEVEKIGRKRNKYKGIDFYRT